MGPVAAAFGCHRPHPQASDQSTRRRPKCERRGERHATPAISVLMREKQHRVVSAASYKNRYPRPRLGARRIPRAPRTSAIAHTERAAQAPVQSGSRGSRPAASSSAHACASSSAAACPIRCATIDTRACSGPQVASTITRPLDPVAVSVTSPSSWPPARIVTYGLGVGFSHASRPRPMRYSKPPGTGERSSHE
jgi:hypothetical protein